MQPIIISFRASVKKFLKPILKFYILTWAVRFFQSLATLSSSVKLAKHFGATFDLQSPKPTSPLLKGIATHKNFKYIVMLVVMSNFYKFSWIRNIR